MSNDLYPCPCCGFAVFSGPPGTYEICQICGWEDDPVQLSHPAYAGGANTGSLWDCQQEILPDHPPEQMSSGRYLRVPAWRPLRPEDLIEQFDTGSWSFKYYWEPEARSTLAGRKPD